MDVTALESVMWGQSISECFGLLYCSCFDSPEICLEQRAMDVEPICCRQCGVLTNVVVCLGKAILVHSVPFEDRIFPPSTAALNRPPPLL